MAFVILEPTFPLNTIQMNSELSSLAPCSVTFLSHGSFWCQNAAAHALMLRMMITAYHTSISLSSHALLPSCITLQILCEAANAHSSAGDADGVNPGNACGRGGLVTTGALCGVLAAYQSPRWVVTEQQKREPAFHHGPFLRGYSCFPLRHRSPVEGHRCHREAGRGLLSNAIKIKFCSRRTRA